ncbi:hypothetical protein [Singulisphaera sp. PoT]|uniref:hypothetical protein n=1 Tax=Singulisphaera sp. PoT TaxID=3411797 RepID=UPI003BF4F6AF
MLFAYFAPETTLPLASTAAAAAGVVMMFGKSALRVLKGMIRSRFAPAAPAGSGADARNLPPA